MALESSMPLFLPPDPFLPPLPPSRDLLAVTSTVLDVPLASALLLVSLRSTAPSRRSGGLR